MSTPPTGASGNAIPRTEGAAPAHPAAATTTHNARFMASSMLAPTIAKKITRCVDVAAGASRTMLRQSARMNREQTGGRVHPGDQPRAMTSILLVDDHVANLDAFEAILAPLGHRIMRASSGEQALAQLSREDFGLVLLDVQMPTMDGFATAALIKGRPRSRRLPIIFVTAGDVEPDQMA